MSTELDLIDEMLGALPGLDRDGLVLETDGGLPSVYPASELATASVSVAALATARLVGSETVTVDRRLASFWFSRSIYPIGWELPSAWDPISGDYRTRDGWLRLHTNAPLHRAAALGVLQTDDNRDRVTAAVSRWGGEELERAVIAAGGCAAVMRSPEDWKRSAQAVSVAAEPLIAWQELSPQSVSRAALGARPLHGVRVLDLTRILAGPVATRFLALLGADVLRIDPPDWNESIIPEVALGKRTARMDLRQTADRAILTELLATADVIVHGYRPGALERLGFGATERQRIRPGLIDVSLDAYGWSGPRRNDRGFDSLVQMSTGIAYAGMVETRADRPVPLPFQALDQATGYLAAASTLVALTRLRRDEIASSARLSLARTARLLAGREGEGNHAAFAPVGDGDFDAQPEATSWGPARRLRPPFHIEGVKLQASAAHELGSDEPRWLERRVLPIPARLET